MTVRLVLHILGAGVLLYEGLLSECPPIPRPGDEIVHEKNRVRVESVRHHYWVNQVEVSLLSLPITGSPPEVAAPVA